MKFDTCVYVINKDMFVLQTYCTVQSDSYLDDIMYPSQWFIHQLYCTRHTEGSEVHQQGSDSIYLSSRLSILTLSQLCYRNSLGPNETKDPYLMICILPLT